MRFMLMMNTPRATTGAYQVTSWAPEDFKAHIQFMHDLNRELKESSELVTAEGLAPPAEAKLVRAAKGGGPPATDGVFPDAREFLAGFWIVDVDRAERAYEIAGKASAAPGPGGAPLFMPIEVRQIMRAPATNA